MGKILKLAGVGLAIVIGILGATTQNVTASSYKLCETDWNCLTIQKIPEAEADKEWGLTSDALDGFLDSYGGKLKIIFDENDKTAEKTKLMGLLKALENFYKNEPAEKRDKMTKALKRINKIKITALNSEDEGGLVIDDELYLVLKNQFLDRTNKTGLSIERIDVRGPLDLSNISVENLKSLIKRSGGAFSVKNIYAGTIKTKTYDRADVILDEIGLDHVSTNTGWPSVEADAGISIVGNASSDIKKVKIPWRPNPWNNWTLTIDKVEKTNSKLLAAHSGQITAEDILATWDITMKDAKGKLTANMNMGVEITIGIPTGTEETFASGSYFIYNRHGDKTEKIGGATYDATTKTVSFKSLKFSEFTITTKSLSSPSSPALPTMPPTTTPTTPPVATTNTTTLGAPDTGLTKEEDIIVSEISNNSWMGIILLGLFTLSSFIIGGIIQKKANR